MTRIYLIGAGTIAHNHAEAIRLLPDDDPITLFVTDIDVAMLDAFIRRFPHAHPYPDLRTMLAEPAERDDIVIVATPPFAHYDPARLALKSGRHVLCEKPLAMNCAEAEQLLETAHAHDRLLGCCSCRFLDLPTTAQVKRLLQDHALGAPYHLSFVHRLQRERPGIEYQAQTRWFLDRSKSGGGPLIDWGPYDFATMNDLLQPARVDVVNAWLARPLTAVDPTDTVFDVEEQIGANLDYHLHDKTIVHVTYERSGCTHGEAREIVELEGTSGAVRWDWPLFDTGGSVSYTHDQAGEPVTKITPAPASGDLGFHDRPLVNFYRRVHGETSSILINEQALFNFACIQAVYACAESGQPQTVQGSFGLR